jgi:Spy/CpxP family protein refolding chaperone
MISRRFRIAVVFLFLGAFAGWSARAQGKPPGGSPGVPPPGPPPAGAPGSGPYGPGGASGGSQPPRGSGGAPHSSLGFGPVGRWWDDKSVIQAIGLRKAQQRKMDDIFNANKPAILASYKIFLNEQKKLDELNKDSSADKARVFSAIDAVNQARAALQKATSQTLLQIRSEMDADQIAKLEKLPNQ